MRTTRYSINTSDASPLQSCEVLGRAFNLVYKSAKDSIQYSGAFLAVAAASHYFFSYATFPSLTISGTIFLTRTVIRTLKVIPYENVKTMRIATERKLYDLNKKVPKLPHVVLVTCFAVSPFFPTTSIALSLAYGIYKGLWIEIDRTIRPSKEALEASNLNNEPLI